MCSTPTPESGTTACSPTRSGETGSLTAYGGRQTHVISAVMGGGVNEEHRERFEEIICLY